MAATLFGAGLILLGLGMMVRHRVHWRRQQADDDATSIDFLLRQVRRRMLASGLIAVIGLCCLLGQWVVNPYWQVVYWGATAAMVMFVIALAMADLWSTREHFGQLQSEFLTRRAELEAEVKRLQQTAASEQNSNGKPGPNALHQPSPHEHDEDNQA